MSIASGASESSADLLRHALFGQPEALGALLERLRPWLRVLAEGMLNANVAARIDASDIVQQTCLSIHRRLPQFQGDDVAAFLAWVREIHRRNVIDEVRRHVTAEERSVQKEQPLDGNTDGLLDPTPQATHTLQLGEETILLARAMEHLPPSQRQAVALRYLEELPLSQISRQMGISPDAVTSLIRRGLMQLETRLRPHRDS